MRNYQTQWTTRELEQLRILKGQNLSEALIAERLNRTENAIKAKWQLLGTNKEKVRALKDAANAKRRAKRAIERAEMRASVKLSNQLCIRGLHGIKVPEDVHSDWRRRGELSHETITALLCGDPLPGYSALDRR